MITISQALDQLPEMNFRAGKISGDSKSSLTGQSSLPLTRQLSCPIYIEGQVNTAALFEDIAAQLLDASQGNDVTGSSFSHSQLVSKTSQTVTLDIGIDEVGRGPLYGSVVVAAVILPHRWSDEMSRHPLADTSLSLLADSKKLTEPKREALYPLIQSHALAYVTVEVPAGVIDELNILQATLAGMSLAAEQLMSQVSLCLQDNSHISLDVQAEQTVDAQQLTFKVLIDGNQIPALNWQKLTGNGVSADKVMAEAWVKGDARHTAIAAASVLAKVKRDRQVIKDGKNYPEYGLERHKGYPTKAHLAAITQHGVLPQHRRSFKPIAELLLKQS